MNGSTAQVASFNVTGTGAVGGAFQAGSVQAGTVQVGGTSMPPCDSSHAGTMFWSATALQVCNGASWGSVLTSAGPPSQAILWSGGCSQNGTAGGTNTYCLDVTDFSNAATYLSVAPSGTVTFLTPGLYRVSYAGAALGSFQAFLYLLKNGTAFYTSPLVPGATWIPVSAGVVWPFAAGDTLQLQISNPGSYAFVATGSGGMTRLQIAYAGAL